MKTIQIIILLMSLIDLGATYLYISNFHSKFPNLDYTSLEANPILRIAMKNFGITKGIIFGGIIVFLILTLLVFNFGEKFHYFLTGVFSMMIIYHFLNFAQLAALKGAG